MVVGQIGLLKYGCELKLVGCHLVVASLAGYTEFVGLDFEVEHEGLHTFGYRTEVVVLKLLVLADS